MRDLFYQLDRSMDQIFEGLRGVRGRKPFPTINGAMPNQKYVAELARRMVIAHPWQLLPKDGTEPTIHNHAVHAWSYANQELSDRTNHSFFDVIGSLRSQGLFYSTKVSKPLFRWRY